MDLSDWSVIAEIVSAIGIIVTLIYLSIQVHQNTRQLKAQTIRIQRDELLSHMDTCTNTKENAEIFQKGINNFNLLTNIEKGYFHSLAHPLIHGFHSIWESNKAGFISDQDMIAGRELVVSILLSPGANQWWSSFKHIPPASIVEYLDEWVEKSKTSVKPANEVLPWLIPEE